MIDLHTHLLPGIDDGSINDEMTVRMIEESKKQGIDCIVATPHFYPNVEDIETFLKRRDASYNRIKDDVDIKLLKGAEVQYFIGISKNEDVSKLRIEGTNTILVEMPFYLKFDKSMVNDLIDLSEKYTVVLAHFERYLGDNKIKLFKNLCNHNIVLQVNANSFNHYFLRKKLLKLVKKGYISVVASDMHNTSTRPQNLGRAMKIIEKDCGADAIEIIKNKTCDLLK